MTLVLMVSTNLHYGNILEYGTLTHVGVGVDPTIGLKVDDAPDGGTGNDMTPGGVGNDPT